MIAAALLLHLALAQSPNHALLDVPFVAQSPELCGGAAVSMVFNYWGLRDVYAQDFAALVSHADGGILTSALAKAVTDRGWTALVDAPSGTDGRPRMRDHIDRGRPIVALIEVAPRTYHYIVIVGLTDREVVFHDPARAAFRVLEWPAFDAAWSRANRWMMVPLPPDDLARRAQGVGASSAAQLGTTPRVAEFGTTPRVAELGTTPPYGRTACSPMIGHAVDAALAGKADEADAELSAAVRLCPNDPAAWREYAGLRFAQARYTEAASLVARALRLAPNDTYAWELAATSRYLNGDVLGALDAWNGAGEPRVGRINIDGADRTPLPVVMTAIGLTPRSMLTADTFMRATRRLRDLPIASSLPSAHLKLTPADDGVANIDAVLFEKPAYPRTRRDWLETVSRPVLQREVRLDIAGLAGSGDAAFVAWRFARHRPRVNAGVAFPSPGVLPGITSFHAMWEEQNYAASVVDGTTIVRQARRRAGLDFSDWARGWLKWQAGAALDRFDAVTHLSFSGSLTARSRGDRASMSASASGWSLFDGAQRFRSSSIAGALRTTADSGRRMLSGTAEFRTVSDRAPLALWPSAGTGTGSDRASFLRGHQLIDDGFVVGDALGRKLLSGTIEYSHPIATVRTIGVALATFVDAARVSRRPMKFSNAETFIDGGVGLRVKLPGTIGGLRVDLAHPFGDGRVIVSAGWIGAWPR